jgi:hypothetical protein
MYAYNLGVAQGIAESGRAVAASGSGVPIVVWPPPWGFGFFPFFPLFFILFWFVMLRGLFWRGPWRRRGIPPELEEWHRRAHAHEMPSTVPQTKA